MDELARIEQTYIPQVLHSGGMRGSMVANENDLNIKLTTQGLKVFEVQNLLRTSSLDFNSHERRHNRSPKQGVSSVHSETYQCSRSPYTPPTVARQSFFSKQQIEKIAQMELVKEEELGCGAAETEQNQASTCLIDFEGLGNGVPMN